jgi:hypothetical protein
MENVGIFYAHLEYMIAFGIFYGNFVYFPRFGTFCQAKSGNPGSKQLISLVSHRSTTEMRKPLNEN